MHMLLLLVLLLCPVVAYSADPETPPVQNEPKLYDHYLKLQRLQESMGGGSLDDQARLQPHLNQAERQACEQVRRERQEGVPKEDYLWQGGDQFLVFAQQLEQYCFPPH